MGFQHVALVGKYKSPQVREALRDVAVFMQTQGLQVSLESETAISTGLTEFAALTVAEIGAQCDLALAVGGDGTMLGIGRQLAEHRIPLMGVNQGRLGFITDVALADFRELLAPMLQGEFAEDRRALIDARVMRRGKEVFAATAMNDVVVNRGATSGMVELRTEVDGCLLANQRADGLIIATPTGSTAYSLSAGGPLLNPSVGAFVLVPIAPHTLSNRPIVLADDVEISVEVIDGRGVSANFDMQSLAELEHGDRVVVRRSEHSVRFLHPKGWSYYDTLRRKLHWNEGN